MPKVSTPLGDGSYESTARQFSSQRCVNMFTAVARNQSLNDTMLLGSPGISQFSTTGIKPSRGAIVMDDVYYIVCGELLCSVDSLGVATSIGTISGTIRVVMAHNGEKLAIVVPGGNSYVYNKTTDILVQITDVDFRISDTVCFKDGYYIFTETDSNVFFVSALNDPLSFDALDFATAELAAGNIVGCHSDQDQLFIFKSDMTEVFQNVGGSGFPFQRIPGAAFEKGIHSRYSPIQFEGSFFYVGGGHNERSSIYRSGGGEPLSISTDSIDREIQEFARSEIAKSFTFTYSIEGFSFVGFTFRSANTTPRTFVYNVTASELLGRPVWQEQQTGINDGAWRVNSIDTVYSKLLVSDYLDGRVGEIESDLYTEYGDTILRLKTTGPMSGNGTSFYISSIELTTESGEGLNIGQGSDPEVMMDFSDDGARTWSSEYWRPLGKIGEYFRRTAWRRLGRVPAHRVWRFKQTDPIKTAWIKLESTVRDGG